MMRTKVYLTIALVVFFIGGFIAGIYYRHSQGPGTVLYEKRAYEGTANCPEKGPEYCGFEELRIVFLGEWQVWVDNQNPSTRLNVRDRNDTYFTITKPSDHKGLGTVDVTRQPFDLSQPRQPVMMLADVGNRGTYNHISYTSWFEENKLMIAKDFDMNGVVDKRVVVDHGKEKTNAP